MTSDGLVENLFSMLSISESTKAKFSLHESQQVSTKIFCLQIPFLALLGTSGTQ